ncbi:lipocalin family protein [Flavobacterium sp.]
MKKLIVFFGIILFVSCQQKINQDDIVKLNGYWEISSVTKIDGEKKEYKVNETIDFFEIKNNIGFRQKVMPQFDGTFKTNDIKESIKIIDSNKIYFIQYTTDYGKWKEQVIELKDSTLVLKNKDNLQYTYKKFKPFSFK